VPDLLLREARLLGLDAPVDVAVDDGMVAAISPTVAAGRAEVVECEGRLLLPGLWDEHVHLTQAALAAARLPLGALPSAAATAEAVRDAIAGGVPGEVLVGAGFRDAVWPDAPTRAALDAAAGDVPVLLVSHDTHCVWLNGAAASRFGVEVDDTGLLREEPAFRVGERVTKDADPDAAVRRLADDAASRGVVGIVDLEMTWNVDPWRRRVGAGFDALRVEAGVYPQDLDRAERDGLRTGTPLGSGLVTVGPLKVLIDGALNTRTAYCLDPYPDGSTGLLTVPRPGLEALLRRAAALGLTPVVHAIGDAAVRSALDAFEATGLRGRIEHAQLVADEDLPRFGRLGVVASVQPGHLLDDRDVAERHWPGRAGRTFPLRSLLDAGATLAFGSDAPVAPLDPWVAIRAAVERSPDGEPWHPEQRITLEEALAASARGRLRPAVGEAADLVLVEQPLEAMRAEGVAATLLAGRFTHRRL
jgi:predicted amidohydrolase YtcJ